MFKNAPLVRSGNSETQTGTPKSAANDDDDNISLTSTVTSEHDPDKEFTVETIHLEAPAPDGETLYLVEWADYPLSRCTWEPASNIGPELSMQWEAKKERQRLGLEEGWTFETWQKFMDNLAAKHADRHRRRNARRKRLGLPLTEPFDSTEVSSRSSPNSDSDEAEEDTSILRQESSSRARSLRPEIAAANDVAEQKHRTATKSTSGIMSPTVIESPPAVIATAETSPKQRKASLDRPVTEQARKYSTELARKFAMHGPRGGPALSTGSDGTARKMSDGAVHPRNLPPIRAAGPSGASNENTAENGKRLTAKKTNPVRTGGSNVFSSGTMPKKRTHKPPASGPNAPGTLYPTLQARRRAELKSRNKEDLAPSIPPHLASPGLVVPGENTTSPQHASVLLSEAPAQRRQVIPVPEAIVAHGLGITGNMAIEPESAGSSSATNPSSALAPAKERPPVKKRKSVRFTQDDDEPAVISELPDSEPMDVDSPTDKVTSPGSMILPQPDVAKNAKVQTIEKKLKFGVAPEIMASFQDVAASPEDAWITEFSQMETLTMNYTVSVHDFNVKKDFMWTSLLSHGALSSPSDTILERVAINLRDGDSGICYFGSEYSLIVYPTGCDEWKQIAMQWELPASATGTATALRYVLFRPAMDCRPFLRSPATQLTTSSARTPVEENASFRGRMMRSLLRFDYQRLLPVRNPGSEASADYFFLVFPPSKNPWLSAVFNWLRACRPDCRIYVSQDPGGWSAFCRDLGDSGSGTIIIHELVSLHLHRFPELWRRLNRYRDVYWCLSEAAQPQPVFPSLTLPDEVVPPGEVFLTELFPYEKRPSEKRERDAQFLMKRTQQVIFITPSFLTAEPQRTWELLDYFWTFHSRHPQQRLKLVTACDLAEYLENLAEEKSIERAIILGAARDDVVEAEREAKKQGVGREDCECRVKACAIAWGLHYRRERVMEVNEELSPLIYAPKFIDSNDEQSLVNWFGWWSGMRMDQFRGVYVLGSGRSMNFNGSRKGQRLVRIPRYSSVTINDPDLVRETVVESRNEALPPALPQTSHGPPTSRVTEQSPVSKGDRPWKYRSKRLPFEYRVTPDWRNELERIERNMPPTNPVRLYFFPISWVDSEISWHYGDSKEIFSTYMRWWNYARHFHRGFLTYLGYFYTVTDDWEAGQKPASQNLERYPWLCIYRPVMPPQMFGRHFAYGAPVELIIWDPAAKDRFPDDKMPREEDLIFAQRMAIDLVRTKTAEKNTDSWLKQVWYGGFTPPAKVDSPYPVDLTLQWLEEFMQDPFGYLPNSSHLSAAGFRKVQIADLRIKGLSGASETASGAGAAMDIDMQSSGETDDEESGDDSCMIFHPPRGILPPGESSTRCYNHLYEAARAARRDINVMGRFNKEMPYEFRPTVDWFQQHRNERRGHEHMHVGPWESVCLQWEESFKQHKAKASASVAASQSKREASGSRG